MRDFRQHLAGRFTQPVSRRSLARGVGVAGMAATLGAYSPGARAATLVQSSPTVDIAGTSLSILQWQHFVPSFDTWFEQFLTEWGGANGVTVYLERIDTADVPGKVASEIAAGQGHDIVEHIAPLPQFEESMLDLTDLVTEATVRHGAQLDNCMKNSYNPTTNRFFGFTHGFAPNLANYWKSLWEPTGFPTGPATFEDLSSGGGAIWNNLGIMTGIGISREIDSNMAAQAMIWAFGGSVQDENEKVIINSPETLAAVETMKALFENCMTPEVFSWNAASNNQLFVAGQASYIFNSISAYRTAQEQQPETGADIVLSTPLVGPGGPQRALSHSHAAFTSMIPNHAANPDTAKEFLLHLVANYAAAAEASKLYNFPAFPNTVPGLTDDGGPLDNDPYGSAPPDKLAPLKTSSNWTVNLGWPGPANAMIGECFNTFLLSDMMAKAARGDMSPQDAITEAETKLNQIAQNWRDQGLMGGGQ